MVGDSLLTDDAWRKAQDLRDRELRMQEIMRKQVQTESEFREFMNDRGEMRRMPFKIRATKLLRNPGLELRVLEQNREMDIYYLLLAGSILCLFSVL